MIKFTYEIQDKLGLHARPAGALVKTAGKLSSKVVLQCKGKEADCKKLIALMRMGIKYEDVVTFIVEGDNEAEDSRVLKEFCQVSLISRL